MSWLDIFKRTPKEEWRLVKECTPIPVERTSRLRSDTDKGKIYIYLYESSRGNRCLQARSTMRSASQEQTDDFVRTTDLYMRRIYRWLMGRADPEIMRYDEVEQEEVMHYLQGAISETLKPFTVEDK